jgi:hypothetical protein
LGSDSFGEINLSDAKRDSGRQSIVNYWIKEVRTLRKIEGKQTVKLFNKINFVFFAYQIEE